MLIRMPLESQLSIGTLNLLLRSIPLHTEDLVVVLLLTTLLSNIDFL